jgi:hypothetical protein
MRSPSPHSSSSGYHTSTSPDPSVHRISLLGNPVLLGLALQGTESDDGSFRMTPEQVTAIDLTIGLAFPA